MELRRLEEYLARLPDGIDSYPDQLAKATTFLDALADKPIDDALTDLPAPLAELVKNPVAASAWVPEVHVVALFKVIGDVHFEGAGGTPAFLRWVHNQNTQLLAKPWYKVLFLVVKPERVFNGVQHRWRAFRRGTALKIAGREENQCRIELTYAPQLLDEEALLAIGTAIRAAAEAAGAKKVEIDVDDVGETVGTFTIRWTL